jgi:hypothetical protein
VSVSSLNQVLPMFSPVCESAHSFSVKKNAFARK